MLPIPGNYFMEKYDSLLDYLHKNNLQCCLSLII